MLYVIFVRGRTAISIAGSIKYLVVVAAAVVVVIVVVVVVVGSSSR